MSRAFLFVPFFLAFAGQAQAYEPLLLECDNEQVRVSLDTMNGSVGISGMLDVPTPGYSHSFSVESQLPDETIVRLRLKGPDMAAIQVIDRVTFQDWLAAPKETQTVRIRLEKDFNWGPDEIICGFSEEYD